MFYELVYGRWLFFTELVLCLPVPVIFLLTPLRKKPAFMRQVLDLYACIRPIRYFQGIESPVKHPERVNMWYDREQLLPGNRFDGPALVAEPSATTLVPPGAAATVDAYGNLVIDAGSSS